MYCECMKRYNILLSCWEYIWFIRLMSTEMTLCYKYLIRTMGLSFRQAETGIPKCLGFKFF